MRFKYGLILLFNLWLPFLTDAQEDVIPKLRDQFSAASNDTLRLNTAKQLFGQYVYTQVDSAIYFAEQVVALAEKLKSKKEMLNGNNYLSVALSIKGDYEKAAVYAEETLRLHTEAGDSINMAYTYNNLGLNYTYAGDYLKASENLIAAARIKEALVRNGTSSADADLASTIMNLGVVYQNQLDTAQAKAYFEQAIEEAAKAGNDRVGAQSQLSLGNILIEQGESSEALKMMLSAEAVFKTSGDLFSLGKLYNNITLAYAGLEQGREVVRYANLAIETNRQIGNQYSEALGFVYLGLGYIKTRQYRQAIRESNKALIYGEENEANDIRLGALKNLYEAYEALGDYKKAFDFSLRFKEVDELIFAEERAEQIERLSAAYEADKREIEIDNLNKEAELQSLELSKANSERKLLLTLLLSVLIILSLLMYLYRKIVLNKRLLGAKNDELESLNKTKDRFFAIVAHDLRGHIAAFQGTGRLLKHFSAKNDQEKIEKITSEIDNNAGNLSHLLDNLLHWSMEQLHGYKPKPERVNVAEVIDELISIYLPLAKVKGLTLRSELTEDVLVVADRDSLFLIFRNLIANALKFTEDGEVIITGERTEKQWRIAVCDTGIGIPEILQAKLFAIGEEKIRRGTANEKGTGLGLNLAFEFSRMNEGILECESTEGQGTCFYVTLPHV
ncbi:MAG: sensor histidine kinase [Roseivirga sp.]|nr:sensor histidine kinase [Roseivirga sp.]